MSPIALRDLLLAGGLAVSTQEAVTAGRITAPEAVRAVFAGWIWLSATLVLAAIAWVNGLQPQLAAAFFSIAAFPALVTFALLPLLNTVAGSGALLCVWLASATVLTAATGGALSPLSAAFLVVLAQCVALERPWLPEVGAAIVLAYAGAAVIAGGRVLANDLGGWPQMMVVAYITFSAGLIASARAAVSRHRIEQRFAEVAHELRTPLTHIIGFSEMIERQISGPLNAKYVEYAELIRTSGNHLLRLVNDMLDISRIDADRYVLHFERFDARAVIEEVVRLSEASAVAKSIELAANVPDEAIYVRADRQALFRILINIIGNALKFTPEGGRVVVRAAPAGDTLMLETIDSGPGIPPAERERLGKAYERGAGALGIEGAGLGLSLVRALAALHGGALSFDDAPGGGAIVRVILPVLATE